MMNRPGYLVDRNQPAMSYLRLKPECLMKALEIIEREFTSEWLDRLSAKYATGAVASLTSFHPVYHGILGGTVNPLTLEVVELATYLEYLRKVVRITDPQLSRLVRELRSEDKFYAYLFQLMVTARCALVVPQLRVEPMIKSRRPDIAFGYLATEFIVETTRPTLPEKTTKLHDFFERLFFWFEGSNRTGGENVSVRLSARTLDIMEAEREIRTALLQAKARVGATICADDFIVESYQFAGTLDDFRMAHEPCARQGTELAFVSGKATSPPTPPETDTSHLWGRTTLVVDLSAIEGDLYQDPADKIDVAVQQKCEQLLPLRDSNREIYLFLDLGGLPQTPRLDMHRVLARLYANAFAKHPGLLGGVVFAERVWDQQLRRFRMALRPVFAPGERHVENFFLFRDLRRVEAYNDFIGSVVGWAESDNGQCSCGSGETYGQCCKGILTVSDRLNGL